VTAPEALVATKRRLIERGWRKGSVGGKTGPNCLVGALEHEIPDNEWPTAGTIAMAALRAATGQRSLVAWNDAQIGVGNVLAAIDNAIKELQACPT